MDDIDINFIQEAAKGDLDAFEKLYQETSSFVYSVAFRILSNKEDSEDITQEVFIKIFENLNKFQYRSSFKTWIYRITTNCALTKLKKRIRIEAKQIQYDDALLHNKQRNETESEEENKKLLNLLKPQQRTCIILREIEGLSYQEISDVLKMNINTVRTQLKRAREILIKSKRKAEENELQGMPKYPS